MKKQLFCMSLSLLGLTACGGGSDSSTSPVSTSENYYSFNGSEVGLANIQVYHIDQKNNFTVQYSEDATMQSEAFRNYIVQDAFSSSMPPQLDAKKYLIGENASFDGSTLKYTVSNLTAEKPLILTQYYKKIDVSGLNKIDDLKNPIRELNSSTAGQILAAMLGLYYADNDQKFPKGSFCWQKQTAISNQPYIEFYPNATIAHVNEDSAVESFGNWNKVGWTEFQRDTSLSYLANVKIQLNNQGYWGFYQSENQNFDQNNLRCDLMNETAFQAVNKPFKALVKS